ncbi:MAG: 30S ribosomal protein S2 [Candidatus Falkowbacteria bacterium GW2011_GWC2_38_22]|uniref:Small ribosomal subunit protein uS2 n=1 Tax=Candidatus Falkowbacteria bacterium GW2011_GWE1_38_31 TaxID=1618638 RepID=A0A0G0N0U8_9BACT|nr:MAG: 30S ribosomal protein S2 [Candidatus Falkowbacteria bacterium GW2011_GWF2_38_1205]KKQ61972.1 MAG: 30S ribosomal protein S2 [Candidatus Falkowbacteria bacterium GW2011_GWC2_38_22]KKQ63866.1 MAG: 30S ribosomal protein S2 [Candidatus Falkowbacteria bacterium GW2011_GWF1_38_22]KKQ66123.1 MAG: 30S ribosomal protein S2 [Candidatus Falkowbacteria bacterium GW2011_GWE2_38_254]KKQ70726.1 MAG: 30S ribosomal protein S2 [Candidatus Falkowbacteria bacterium GW2011_GWE1_38_31]KKQ73096.1 MAG: 30S rib
MTTIPTIEQMLKAGMHFGHRTSKWHPKFAPYIFDARNGVHIIDLVKSRQLLETALEYIKKMAAEDKTILFVGTKIQAKKTIERIATESGMPYVKEKWMGGCLTNFAVIKKVIKKYNDLSRDKAAGTLDKYTKKERLNIDRELARLKLKVGGLTNVTRMPDALFIWDIGHEKTAMIEAQKKNIPIIAVCDTNSNPSGINYVIPSNDDATKTIKLLLNAVCEAVLEGKKERASASATVVEKK